VSGPPAPPLSTPVRTALALSLVRDTPTVRWVRFPDLAQAQAQAHALSVRMKASALYQRELQPDL